MALTDDPDKEPLGWHMSTVSELAQERLEGDKLENSIAEAKYLMIEREALRKRLKDIEARLEELDEGAEAQ